MPKPKSTPSGDKKFAPFVSCELTDQEKDFCRENPLTAVKALQMLTSLVEEGYRLNLYFDEYNDAAALIVTGVSDTCPNKGWALSSRGPSVQAAFTVWGFKHHEKFQGVWPKETRDKQRSQWG